MSPPQPVVGVKVANKRQKEKNCRIASILSAIVNYNCFSSKLSHRAHSAHSDTRQEIVSIQTGRILCYHHLRFFVSRHIPQELAHIRNAKHHIGCTPKKCIDFNRLVEELSNIDSSTSKSMANKNDSTTLAQTIHTGQSRKRKSKNWKRQYLRIQIIV